MPDYDTFYRSRYYFSRFLSKKFDVIKSNIPVTMRGMDNAANESGVSEIPIFLLNTTPIAAAHVPMMSILFPFG
ncbi:MAG TPA: hypothetical protein VK072_09320 [Candidatus Avamphibacillus sp.]|nr:hypothetical protein [Candidatus Avamphibacillus sp.]